MHFWRATVQVRCSPAAHHPCCVCLLTATEVVPSGSPWRSAWRVARGYARVALSAGGTAAWHWSVPTGRCSPRGRCRGHGRTDSYYCRAPVCESGHHLLRSRWFRDRTARTLRPYGPGRIHGQDSYVPCPHRQSAATSGGYRVWSHQLHRVAEPRDRSVPGHGVPDPAAVSNASVSLDRWRNRERVRGYGTDACRR